MEPAGTASHQRLIPAICAVVFRIINTRKKIPQVAIMISTSQDWGRRIMKGIINYANEVGPWHLWVNSNPVMTLKGFPAGWKGDGIIGRIHMPALASEIKRSKIPTVNVADNELPNFKVPCVRTDDREGARLAAEHLLGRGMKKFAFVGSVQRTVPKWYAEAFKGALAAHEMDCDLFDLNPDEQNARAQLSGWLVGLTKPVGILACGNTISRMVVESCLECGISVPHDVAVLGTTDDELFSHACFPALSAVLAPTEQIGYRAAQLLHQMMRGKKVPPKTIYLPPLRVVERLSTDTLAVGDPQLVKVVAYIREHAFDAIGMDDLLRAVPMARRSMERRFHHAFGRSPVDEIRRIRIDRARQLLAETEFPMQDIAERCGYATYNHLTNVFKITTGLSPRDYRKLHRS